MKQNEELQKGYSNLFRLINWLDVASMHYLACVAEDIQKGNHVLRIIKNNTIALHGQTFEFGNYDDNSLTHLWECIAMLSEVEEKMGYEPNLSAALLISINVRLDEFTDSKETKALRMILFELCHELHNMYNSDDNDEEMDISHFCDYLRNLSKECECEEIAFDDCDELHSAFVIKELSSYRLNLIKYHYPST